MLSFGVRAGFPLAFQWVNPISLSRFLTAQLQTSNPAVFVFYFFSSVFYDFKSCYFQFSLLIPAWLTRMFFFFFSFIISPFCLYVFINFKHDKLGETNTFCLSQRIFIIFFIVSADKSLVEDIIPFN